MHKRTRELIEYGKLCGFQLDGIDGNDHYRLRHGNGEIVRVACTPGDWRGDENCRAEMRRKSGVTPPRPNAGRYRNGTGRRGFNMRAALREKNPVLSGKHTSSSIPTLPPSVADAVRRVTERRDQLAARYAENPYPYIRQELARVEQELAELMRMASA